MSSIQQLPELFPNATNLELVVFDFDGVFTDNTVWITEDGKESVRCWRGDGLGLSALKEKNVNIYVLSTEENPVVQVRCKKLGIACSNGVKDKREAIHAIVRELGVDIRNTAYVGNDMNDRGALEEVGVSIVVADAHPEIVKSAQFQTTRAGGFGAVREVCDWIVRNR